MVGNGIHIWMADTQTVQSRKGRQSTLSDIAKLKPAVGVPGHFLGEAPKGLAAVTYTVKGTTMTTLHYVFDPLCGWCYGAAPLISAARDVPDLTIVLHAGGMMAGANRHAVTSKLRDYVMSHDKRIAQLSGQTFGSAYFDELLCDSNAVLDSAPPSTAILAAEELAGRGLDMLHRLQLAHYVEGRRIADTAVLVQLAQELGLTPRAFAETFACLAGAVTERHFTESHHWLARIGAQGFPTIALEHADGTLARLDVGAWLSRTAEWTDYLCEQVSAQADSPSSNDDLVCSVDGCAI